MKLITKKVENQPLTITVEYPELDEKTKKVIQKIKCIDIGLVGKIDEKSIRVDLSDIYYIENVERKVFLYTKNEVLRFEGTMFDIEKIIPETELVRISRTCIMNIDYLREIRQVKNSRLEAIMQNDEMLIVSRKYLQDIKKMFRRK